MLCQRCKKRIATINHTETINGETCSVNLCDECMAETYGQFESDIAEAILNGLFAEPVREQKVCPACGMRFSDYERSGLLGCPSCYDVFNEELMPYIARIQGNTRHVGKSGGIYTYEHDLRRKLSILQNNLERAIKCGDFAEAGRINERMNALKKSRGGNL